MEQNWYILVEKSDVANCNVTFRVYDGLLKLNNSLPYSLSLPGNGITQAYLDIPRGYPIEITLTEGSW